MAIRGSYTLISDFRNCPHKAARRHILRDLPNGEPSPEMSHGIRVHKAFEERISQQKPLAEDLQNLEPMAQMFKEWGAVAELKLACTSQWVMCDFYAPDAWLVGKLDIVVIDETRTKAYNGDLKTGKIREDSLELVIHALLLKCALPTLTVIRSQYLWTSQLHNVLGILHDTSDVTIAQKLVNSVMTEIHRLAAHPGRDHWPKTPNALCGWCDVMDCEHNKVLTRLGKNK